MATAEALAAALALFDHPASVRLARASRLPKGLTFLLEIAAGEPQALFEARTKTGRSEVALRGAAGFFIEQVLLHPGGDSYRILGGDRDTSARELRRNMALLMRWLHPDVTSN